MTKLLRKSPPPSASGSHANQPHAMPVSPSPARSKLALAHELQVHQVELAMQNEELRRTQVELAAARDHLMDLYDFAPVGYFTTDDNDIVIAANLTGASMLDRNRKLLLGRPFSAFMAPTEAERWYHYRRSMLQDEPRRSIELMLLRDRGGPALHVQLDCRRVVDGEGQKQLRMALTDITPRKEAEIDRRIARSTVKARESERRRVARQLHEDLGQKLSALKMELDSLGVGRRQPARRRIDTMLATLDDAVATIRRISADLRPLMLDDLGLIAAVDWLARDAARRLGLRVTLDLDDNLQILGEDTAVPMFRMVEESLAFMAHVTTADSVDVSLQQQAQDLVLTVRGDGGNWPIPPDAVDAHHALQHLNDQARQLGARLEFGHTNGRRPCVQVRLALDRVAP